ncbi:hypothetical protein CYMTET_16972 [Cymbomonas tetramitiformis]|uniref:Uncharacterized protein n=1 Tax=Cymbomonas tetramitiformis TaxID=36881 RepID=A0AAE0GB42_9CHLO|nr:hypothetical protein CYMTET_16972 [Cymbomonas tetramitiformis]
MGAAITYLSMAILTFILACVELIVLASDSDDDTMASVGIAFVGLSMLMRLVAITLSSQVICCSRVDMDWYGYSIVLAPTAVQVQGYPAPNNLPGVPMAVPMAVPMVDPSQAPPMARPLDMGGPTANLTGPPMAVSVQPIPMATQYPQAPPTTGTCGSILAEQSKPSTSAPNF